MPDILHRIAASALLSSKIIRDATLKVYKGAPHGMCTTLKDQVNEELLAFIQGSDRGDTRLMSNKEDRVIKLRSNEE